jgi:hypothetical protein
MIIDHIEKKIAEEVGKLRAEVNLKRASDDGEVGAAAEAVAEATWARLGANARTIRKFSLTPLLLRNAVTRGATCPSTVGKRD